MAQKLLRETGEGAYDWEKTHSIFKEIEFQNSSNVQLLKIFQFKGLRK